MRKFARYSLEATAPDGGGRSFLAEAQNTVEAWLGAKGTWEAAGDGPGPQGLRLRDGQVARVGRSESCSTHGSALYWIVEQPVEFGVFRTVLGVAAWGDRCALFCELEAGVPSGAVRPVPFEAHCPKVLPQLLALLPEWHVNGDPVVLESRAFEQDEDIDYIRQLVQSPERRLPVVVIARSPDFPLPVHLAPDLAHALCGLAQVIEIGESVSWGLTFHLGKEFSCYNGAVRIFWPFCGRYQNPYHHPLWIHSRILQLGDCLASIARALISQVKSRIFYASTLALRRPECFDRLEAGAAAERLEQARQRLDPSEWVQALEDENHRLSIENRDLHEECRRLQTEAENWKAISDYSPTLEEKEPAPSTVADKVLIASVQDAVERAAERFVDYLIFGSDVADAVAGLKPAAGPPDKIYRYFETLADLARARRNGPLGQTDIAWLKSRSVTCSQESDTVRNDPSKARRRTWDDGEKKRVFSMHLKPTEATRPDRCVRIYFDWDGDGQKFIIGFVGRHPD